MAAERVQRRLAAIVAADVVGYSRLIEQDEAGTLATLKERRTSILAPLVAQHQGRVIKVMGDGVLIEFASAVNAVACAAALQARMAEANAGIAPEHHIVLRVGVNLGDVVVDGGDLYGDGVNVAARLQALATPGEVFVSGSVHEQVKRKLDLGFDALGPQTVKNIAEPVTVYRVRAPSPLAPDDRPVADMAALALPSKPSVAVLPFQNMSGDPEQDYFADGMVEEIITALSRFNSLFVIARNSSFTYKGRAVDVKLVGRELGVRYVLEGSVRKAASRVRITGQLIDATTGAHLWADRFDGEMADIFALQDQVTANVVAAIAPKLEHAEIERARRKPTASLDAYDYFLRGMAAIHSWTSESNAEALACFSRAIALDDAFASAYGLAARCYAQRKVDGWLTDRADDIAEATRLARRAAELGRDDAVALCTAGFALADVAEEFAEGDRLIERALQLNPNLAWAWLFSAWVKCWLGQADAAYEHASRAMRLSPHDPHMFIMQSAAAYARLVAGRYDEALLWAEAALREKADAFFAQCCAAASRALLGQPVEARAAMVRLREREPSLRVSTVADRVPTGQPQDFARWAAGLRQAGLPE